MKISRIIQITAFCVLIGRAYQFYFFGAPYRAIFWNEALLTSTVENLLGMSWFEYATSPKVDGWIQFLIKSSAIIFFITGIITVFWQRITSKIRSAFLYLSIFIFLFLSFCLFKDKNYDFLQFFELGLQFAALVALLFLDKIKKQPLKTAFLLKIAIAVTFTSHGLFAMGFPYLPGYFIDMTINILGVNEDQATIFLFIMGLLDVILSLLIFIPKTAKYALIYAIIWGTFTALSRLISGFNPDFFLQTIHQSLPGTIYRLPHGLVPFITLIIHFKTKLKQQL